MDIENSIDFQECSRKLKQRRSSLPPQRRSSLPPQRRSSQVRVKKPPLKMDIENSIDFQECSRKLKEIVWVVRVIQSSYENVATAFSVNDGDGGWLLFTCMHLFPEEPSSSYQIEVKMLHEEGFRPAKIVWQNPIWDIALLKLVDDTVCQCGDLAEDGELSAGEILMHVGNPRGFVGSFLVGRVAFECTNDFKLPLPEEIQHCKDYTPAVSKLTPKYMVMGDVFDKKIFLQQEYCNLSLSFKKNLHPLVPIIHMNGFGYPEGCSGGPVVNLEEQIVGMMSGFANVAIHVTMLRECLRLYKKDNPNPISQGRDPKKGNTIV